MYHFNKKHIFTILLLGFSLPSAVAQYIVNDGGYIHIASGTTLDVQGEIRNESTGSISNEGRISISGNITNNGSSNMHTGNGLVELDGTAAQVVQGTNNIHFHNLTIGNSSSGITLSTNATISNILNMTDGDINLNGRMIDLGNTGILMGETNNNRIYGTSGTIQATRDLNAPSAINVAGMGLLITSAANMGTTVINRGHAIQYGPNGNSSIERYYDISPATNTELDASIIFNYFDNELASHTEVNLVAWKSTDGGSNWTNEGGTINTGGNNLNLSTIDGFSRWTLSDEVNEPLPVELLSFTAIVNPKSEVQLDWITISEINSSHFEVERSQNGKDFERIGIVEAAGFSEAEITYHLLDESPYQGVSYYRLRQVDLDHSFEYSEIRTVYISDEKNNISIFPNPIRNEAMLYLQGLPSDEKIRFELYNVKGQRLMIIPIQKLSFYEMKLQDFPSASYFYTIRNQREILKTGQLIITE